MRAVIVTAPGGPEALELHDRPVPEPGPGQVTIDVAFAGVGYVDVLFRTGAVPLPLPLTPGIEVSGHVRAAGAGVELAPGTPVAAMLNDFVNGPGGGGYAEVACAQAALTVPVAGDLQRAAAILVNGATAQLAVHDRARIEAGETVLVLGATGGVGRLMAQAAAVAGAEVIVAVRADDRRPAVADLDARIALTDELGELQTDVVLDPVGGPARAAAFATLRPFGRHVIVGDASGDDTPFSGDAVWFATTAVLGLNVGGITHSRPERVARAARTALDGPLDPGAVAVLGLTDAAEAHERLADRPAPNKILLDATPPSS
jgi:NADPH2:quinone reductase